MPGLVPGIHVFRRDKKTWMAGTRPAMTMNLVYEAAFESGWTRKIVREPAPY